MKRARPKKTSTKQKIVLILFGLFLCAVILEIGLRIGGSVFLFLQEYKNRISIQKRGNYRILCLGESTTAIGGDNSYPSQLERILNQRRPRTNFSVINKGVPAIDTTKIAAQLQDNLDKYSPDIVVAMIGINDTGDLVIYEDKGNKDPSVFFKRLKIYRLLRLSGLHILSIAREIGILNRAYMELTPGAYKEQREPGETSEIAKDTGRVTSNAADRYIESGWEYWFNGEDGKSKKMFKKALKIDPNNIHAYIALARYYNSHERFDDAIAILKKAIKIDPEKAHSVYVELGKIYKEQEEYHKSLEMFDKAMRFNPENSQLYEYLRVLYFELGQEYEKKDELDKSIEMFRNVIDIDPEADEAYVKLGLVYMAQGKYELAENIFKENIKRNPKSDRGYGALGYYYKVLGDNASAKESFEKANRLRLRYYNFKTRRNYKKIKEMLSGEGIILVCVQYPLISVMPLKRMLDPAPREHVYFVDNEGVFQEAVTRASYGEYFWDMFAGDFGHCTEKGNRLLAENIADTIIEILGKTRY